MKLFESLLIISAFYMVPACSKDLSSRNCEELKNAIIENNNDKVKSEVQKICSAWVYSQQNLNFLADTISSQCDINAIVLCFECIDTLPPITELKLSFTVSGALKSKMIDVSYTSGNEIKVVAVHD
ncbi:MAG: hypothetical protein ICV66_02475 [Chitinophagaceae bacterium]|nr:hypothetical protein [Chitinophagaceae bacterium]